MTLLSQKTYPVWHPNTQKRFQEVPKKIKSAHGAYLEIEDGQKVLDMTCSWWVTLHGHTQPEIAEAIYKQALSFEQVLFANFTHEPAIELSRGLLRHLPDHFAKVFFSDNGSTAVEVALKMAFQYWQNKGEKKRSRFLSFENAYHGDTVGAMSVSSRSIFTNVFEPLLFDVDQVPFPSTFDNDPDVEEKEQQCLEAFRTLVQKNKGEYAAFIMEPLIQGAAGMRMCRPEFLRALEAITKEEDILTIYDEVFVGFGRTGELFACSKAQTTPDIICLSKGITGGFLPLSATICSENIYEAFYQDDPMKTFFHGHSYMANPLGCAAGVASLKLLEDNPNAFQRLEVLHRLYSKVLQNNPRVQQLRFCGSIVAFDVITEEDDGYMNAVSVVLREKCMEKGVYIRPLGNTVYLVPPYCITEEELASVYEVLASVLLEL
ncbi:MAG: adenosylmethionine-8-amino-7-oxononanoate aminotransferase [Chlamydiales bacterium]|jgi:adenosylmethionine-8-amino-7-oxononanoate aminotransferase